MAQLGAELDACSEAAAARERRIDSLQAELQLARGDAARNARGLARVGLELDEITVAARARATRMRLDALREAAGVAARVKAIAGADPESGERLLAALEAAVERVAAAGEASTTEDVVDRAANGAEASSPSGEIGSGADGPGSPDTALSPDGRLVSVDIGPFRDFSQLIRFEDAANAIGATEEISIRRFSEGRASIDVSLREPIDLLRELEERCELDFEVRRTGDGEIVLDVDG